MKDFLSQKIFWHGHRLSLDLLKQAIRQQKSTEIDISVDEAGIPYVGHSSLFYQWKNIPPYQNVNLEDAISLLEDEKIFVTLDSKEEASIEVISQIIPRISSNTILVNAYLDELDFYKLEHGRSSDPHHDRENHKLATIQNFKQSFPNVFFQISCKEFDFSKPDHKHRVNQIVSELIPDTISLEHQNIGQAELDYFKELNEMGVLPEVNVSKFTRPDNVLTFAMCDDLGSCSQM